MRSKFVAAVLGVSLALSTMTAYAERPKGVDPVAVTCRAIFDQINGLLDEYPDAYGTLRGEQILAELRSWGKQYQDLGCEDRFGPITRMPGRSIPIPSAQLTHAE